MRNLLFAFVTLIIASVATPCWGQRGVRAPAPVVRPAPIHPFIPHGARQHGDSGSDEIDPFTTFLVVVGGLGAVIVAVLAGRAWRNRIVGYVRIIQVPSGEAPEYIRRAWLGVELPLRRREISPRPFGTAGVLTKQSVGVATGYAVDGPMAVAALAVRSPEAAAWWRQSAPHVVASGYRLFFNVEYCERVS